MNQAFKAVSKTQLKSIPKFSNKHSKESWNTGNNSKRIQLWPKSNAENLALTQYL